jgi:serine phosphatase RsbU (regulator of sigma subunit)
LILSFTGFAIGFLMSTGQSARLPLIRLLMTVPDLGSKLLYLLIPISFAFAILKYRLMNIDVIIRRTVLYSLLTGIVFVLYAVMVAGLGTALVKFAGVRNQTMLIASTVVIALITVPLRNRLQHVVDRNLFRERRDYPQALRNLAQAIGSSAGADDFLRQSAEQIQQALQNRFVLIAMRRDREYIASAKVGVADEILGSVRVPVDEVDASPGVIPDAFRRLGASFTVPIRTHRESLALLVLGSKLSDEEYSADDVDFLNSAASQIALGIENLRLRDEEVEFEQARAMQQILLPTRFPQLDGFSIAGVWQPARSVGGDYFDTLSLGKDRAGICIGDVAGKGMPAALLMANLQAAVKATSSYDAAPASVCERVKTIVGGNLAGGKFISFFYGVLDAAGRSFTYSNAGHNPPILVRADGEVQRLARGGPAMCHLFRDMPHEQETATLASGDRIVLFTDGASEARRGEEEFGEDRLIELVVSARRLGASDLQKRIIDQLRAFTSGNFGDDVTLVVIAAE